MVDHFDSDHSLLQPLVRLLVSLGLVAHSDWSHERLGAQLGTVADIDHVFVHPTRHTLSESYIGVLY